MKNSQKECDDKIETLNKRITSLLKEVASLSKTAKKNRFANTSTAENSNNSGSGTDSPSLQ